MAVGYWLLHEAAVHTEPWLCALISVAMLAQFTFQHDPGVNTCLFARGQQINHIRMDKKQTCVDEALTELHLVEKQISSPNKRIKEV